MTNPIPGADSERAAFETWVIKMFGYDVSRGPRGHYRTASVEMMWLAHELPRAAAKVGANVAADLSNAQIRAIMHNYSRMHQPGHYSDTEFDCLQDVIGFVRECVKQSLAAGAPAETPKPVAIMRDGPAGAWAELTEAGESLPEGSFCYAAQPAPAPIAGDVEKDAARWRYVRPMFRYVHLGKGVNGHAIPETIPGDDMEIDEAMDAAMLASSSSGEAG